MSTMTWQQTEFSDAFILVLHHSITHGLISLVDVRISKDCFHDQGCDKTSPSCGQQQIHTLFQTLKTTQQQASMTQVLYIKIPFRAWWPWHFWKQCYNILVAIRKRSRVPGVMVTQYVEELPPGCTTPDFVRKPIALTIQEGNHFLFIHLSVHHWL